MVIVTERESLPGTNYQITVGRKDIDQPINDFVRDFNKYLDEQNESNRSTNRRSAWAYFLASFTAFVSMMLEWRGNIPKILARIGKKNK